MGGDKAISEYLLKANTGAFLVQMLWMLVTLLTSILLTNILGASEYGVYALVIAWLLVLANFANLGLDTLVVREAASLKAKSQFKSINGLKKFSSKMVLGLSIAVAIISILLFHFWEPYEDNRINHAFILGSLLIPLWSLLMLKSSFLRGLQHIISSEIPLKIIKPIILVAIVFFVIMTSTELTAYQAILINFPAFILAFLYVRQTLNSRTESIKSFEPFFKRNLWIHVGVSFFLLDNFHLLNAKIDTLMLGGMVSSSEVGIYSIGTKMSDLVNVLFAVSITVLGPLVSKLYTEKKISELERTVKKVGFGFIWRRVPDGLYSYDHSFWSTTC